MVNTNSIKQSTLLTLTAISHIINKLNMKFPQPSEKSLQLSLKKKCFQGPIPQLECKGDRENERGREKTERREGREDSWWRGEKTIGTKGREDNLLERKETAEEEREDIRKKEERRQ